MNYFRSCAVLFAVSVGFSAQIISYGTKPNAVVPVLVHSRVSLKPCELVQRGSLVIAAEYAWVEIEGEKSEIYSPEMGPGDYLSPSPPISGHAAKMRASQALNCGPKPHSLLTYQESAL